MRSIIFFFRFLGWFSFRNLKLQPGRAITVLIGIALGAAVFTSVRLSVHASLNAFTKSMDLIAGRADHVLIRPGGYVPENLISELITHPAVQSASPFLSTYVRTAESQGNSFLLIGIDPILDRPLRHWQIAEIRKHEAVPWLNLMKFPFTLVLGEPLARELGIHKGDRLAIEHSRQTKDFKVMGVLSDSGLALVDSGRVALTDIATFQEFIKLYGSVDRIDIRMKPIGGPEDLATIRKTLPKGTQLIRPSRTRKSGQNLIRSYQLNLSILSFASLFVGMFLVYSLVALNAASRRKELAILRAIGGSSQMLFFVFLAEGALFGIAGWLTAIPLSTLLVKYLLGAVSQTISTLFVRVHVDALSLDIWEILLSFGVTFLTAVIAALQPAREAMHVSPNEALEMSQHGLKRPYQTKQLAALGLLCIVASLFLSQVPDVFSIPLPGYIAMFFLFVGFSLQAPWILEKMGHTLSPILRRMAGTPAYLAGHYVRSSGTRTAVSVGALLTAVSLFASLVIMIHSFRQTVELWVHQTVSGDLFLTTKMGSINNFRYPLPSNVMKEIQTLKDEKDIDIVPNRRFSLMHNRFPYEIDLIDMEIFFQYGDFFWLRGDPETARNMAIEGQGALVSEVFSNRTTLSVGDTLETWVEGFLIKLPIIAVVRDYRTDGGVVFYSWKKFRDQYYPPQWTGVRFFFKNRTINLDFAAKKLQEEIVRRCGENLDMVSGRDLRRSVLEVFDETFAITSILLLIALIIAALGITTTLTVMVLERTQQLNTLIAVGADMGQIRNMIFWEALFLVVAGECAGLLCGFMLSYILVFIINLQSFGWTFIYSVNWGALGLSLPLIILTALAAALPAVRAVFRQSPAMLLRER